MKREILLLICGTCLSLIVAGLFFYWFEPRLFGRPTDLTVVQSNEQVVPFYEHVFASNAEIPSEGQLRDPYVVVRNKPLVSELGGTGPHDILGFRNRAVPVVADVITIGDSQTYGRNVVYASSWPKVTERILQDASVYNMSVGGWGGIQYLYALRLAFRLKPRIVIVAFYSGNDASESFRAAYAVDSWKEFRTNSSLTIADVPNYPFPPPKTDSWEVQEENFRTILTPRLRLVSNDTALPAVQAGYDIMKAVIKQMEKECQANGVKLVFAIIPTKELVFANLLQTQKIDFREDYSKQITLEQESIDSMKKSMAYASYVDLVTPLQQAAKGNPLLYPPDWDGHPLASGYEVIGQVVAKHIEGLLPHFKAGLYFVSSKEKIRYYLNDKGAWSLLGSVEVAERLGYSKAQALEISERDVASFPVMGVKY